jgi:hypothetical protein
MHQLLFRYIALCWMTGTWGMIIYQWRYQMGGDATTKGTQYSLYCLTRSRLRRDSRFFEFSAGLVQIIFRKNTFETFLIFLYNFRWSRWTALCISWILGSQFYSWVISPPNSNWWMPNIYRHLQKKRFLLNNIHKISRAWKWAALKRDHMPVGIMCVIPHSNLDVASWPQITKDISTSTSVHVTVQLLLGLRILYRISSLWNSGNCWA